MSSVSRVGVALSAALLAGLLPVGVAAPALAQAGALDTTFSGNGKQRTDFTAHRDWARGIAIQADGKIVAAGGAGERFGSGDVRFALARYNRNGSLDASFSEDGKVRTNFTRTIDYASDVAIQADGKIVVAGGAGGPWGVPTRFALARYNPDGSLDTTFSANGKVMTDFVPGNGDDIPGYDWAEAVAIEPDGKIVAVGSAWGEEQAFALARYNQDGTLDSSFGNEGLVVADIGPSHDSASDLAIQADGKFLAAGQALTADLSDANFAVARFNSDGTVDTSFGEGGTVITNVTDFDDQEEGASAVVVQMDQKIVVAGASGDWRFALARYEVDGTLDSSFSGDGKVRTNFTPGPDGAADVSVQPDGKIIAAGGTGDANAMFGLARYNANGTLDRSFSGNGKVRTDFTRRWDLAYAVAIQANGKIVAAGEAGRNGTFALARYQAA